MKFNSLLKKTKSLITLLLIISSIFLGNISFASEEARIIKDILTKNSFLKLSGNLFETSTLQKLYSLRGYEPIWANINGVNPRGEALKTHFLQNAQFDGLNPSDYWTSTLDSQYKNLNSTNWISFEIVATDSLIRYVSHLCCGKIDPRGIDDDFQLQPRKFNNFYTLNSAISAYPEYLSNLLNQFAPKNAFYVREKNILNKLINLRSSKSWDTNITSPGIELSLGSSHKVISQLKQRFSQLGYAVSDYSNNFDENFLKTLNQFQKYNNFSITNSISSKSSLWRVLGATINERIRQTEINLEKTRWLPDNLESKYVFVNLAFSELKVIENEQTVLSMKTINGRPIRRTPTMRDEIPMVEFNPTWTAPYSIVLKDKLPKLQSDPSYLIKHNIRVYDVHTNLEIDPMTIDWKQIDAKSITNYLFVQDTGYDNALGVVKFHLTNPFNIYLHDSNERNLFSDNYRLLSSGCIRLEKPLDFAAYLLKDQYYSREQINSMVSHGSEGESVISKQRVKLNQPVRLYTMYLTADLEDNKTIRFADDNYGQDYRIHKSLINKRVDNESF